MRSDFKFDSDYNETMSFSSEESFSRLSSYSISYNTQTLITMIEHNEWTLEPEFQRYFIWNKETSSLFIDSLLIGIPTPNLFFGRSSNYNEIVVIDGLQRLKTIYLFFTGKFRLSKLNGRLWNGMYFSDLPNEYKRRLMQSIISVTVVDDIDFNPKIIHELFYRINTKGVALTNQEVRNCVFNGPFNKMLHEINGIESWRNILNNKNPHIRLEDIESILRIFAFIENKDDFKFPLHEFLSEYQLKNKDKSREDLKTLFSLICEKVNNEIDVTLFNSHKKINRTYLEPFLTAIGIKIKNNEPIKNLNKSFHNYMTFVNNNVEYRITKLNNKRIIIDRIYIALRLLGEE